MKTKFTQLAQERDEKILKLKKMTILNFIKERQRLKKEIKEIKKKISKYLDENI